MLQAHDEQQQPQASCTSSSMLPLTMTGQVISAASHLFRVELDVPMQQHQRGATHASTTGSRASADNEDSSSTPNNPSISQPRLQRQALPRTQLICSVRALLRKMGQDVVVGDRVVVGGIDWAYGRGAVEQVLPRSSRLTDPAVANVDLALAVFALHTPPFEALQVSRFLVALEAAGTPFEVVLNKADLVSEAELAGRVATLRSWGYEPLVVSCSGGGRGVTEVVAALAGRTAVLAGPSGAGKSSLINAIRLGRHRPDDVEGGVEGDDEDGGALGGDRAEWAEEDQGAGGRRQRGRRGQTVSSIPLAYGAAPWEAAQAVVQRSGRTNGSSASGSDSDEFLVVGEMSRIGRGMHTTTSVTLIPLPGGGRLADTPGFSQPGLEAVSSTELASHFPEFRLAAEDAGGCRFADCLHVAEPGCAVRAVEPQLARYPHYLKFLREIQEREDGDVRSLQAGKRAREGSAKVLTSKGGAARTEAKLERSRHRRVSRKQLRQGQGLDYDE